MPPKKDNEPAALKVDTFPFGAFVRVSVSSAVLELVRWDSWDRESRTLSFSSHRPLLKRLQHCLPP